MPSTREEIVMPEIDAWESLAHEVRLIVAGSPEVVGRRQIAHTLAVDRSAMRIVPQILWLAHSNPKTLAQAIMGCFLGIPIAGLHRL
jgi:hypothetical protein